MKINIQRHAPKYLDHYIRMHKKVGTEEIEAIYSSPNTTPSILKKLKKSFLIRLTQTELKLVRCNDYYDDITKSKSFKMSIITPKSRQVVSVGLLCGTTECAALMLTNRKHDYVELFVSEILRENGFYLFQLYHQQLLNNDISYHREEYKMQINKAGIITKHVI